MTRLVRDDISGIKKKIDDYDACVFKKQTGRRMDQVAAIAAGLTNMKNPLNVASVTVTSGLGVISGFADTNTAILKHCGIDAATMENSDVAGIQEAFYKNRDLILMADDDIFSMFGAGIKVQSDNQKATGRGYAEALISAMENRGITIKGQEILVLGAGPVGRAAAGYFAKEGAKPLIYDIDQAKGKALSESVEGAVFLNAIESYTDYPYILDATTQGDLIDAQDVTKDTIISAPGVPCIATAAAQHKATVIHNPLELGTIAMYYDCIKQYEDVCGCCQKSK